MARRRLGVWALLLALVCVAAVSAAQQEKPLDNAEIIALTKLDMGDGVILAKIKSARQVAFDTSTDALVKLKEAGVTKAVITAMIERQGAPAGEGGSAQAVTLRSKDGSTELKPTYGIAKTQASPFSIVTWVQFEGTTSRVRTRDRRPVVAVTSEGDPRGKWWFVKASQENDENYRYFDLEGGGAFSMVWSGSPESGSVVKCEAVEEGAGIWVLTPLKDLKPGEYGLFSGQIQTGWYPGMVQGQAVLFDFGVDK